MVSRSSSTTGNTNHRSHRSVYSADLANAGNPAVVEEGVRKWSLLATMANQVGNEDAAAKAMRHLDTWQALEDPSKELKTSTSMRDLRAEPAPKSPLRPRRSALDLTEAYREMLPQPEPKFNFKEEMQKYFREGFNGSDESNSANNLLKEAIKEHKHLGNAHRRA